jgi:ribonuclease J
MNQMHEALHVIPLGGLGEVGMNCLAIECQGHILIVDCGTNFPSDDYGIDVVHPRFDWLVANQSRIAALILTHGHEDHIGGLPYLMRACDLAKFPVLGPPHAVRLVERRLNDHGMELEMERVSVLPLGKKHRTECFEVSSIRVSHSIADATALVITCPAGKIVHTGDFNFDPEPSDGECTDEQALRDLGDQGIDLLLSDSTNVDVRGEGGSETLVEEALDSVIRECKHRVFVALFASNVQRLISLGKIAERRGRRIVLLGRSLLQQVEVAKDLGYLKWSHTLELPVDRLGSYPRSQVMVLCSGTQAEAGSAMMRLALDEHRFARIERGDSVVFSSRVIPGGERAVSAMQDALLRIGAHVVNRQIQPEIHTSGHACRQEQRRMLNLVRPKTFVPVHGTLHHLTQHAHLAQECGVSQTMVVENGQSVILRDGMLERGATHPAGIVAVALGGHVISNQEAKARRDLGRYGALMVSMLCDHKWGLEQEPRVMIEGLPERPSSITERESVDLIQHMEATMVSQWNAFKGRTRERLEVEVERFVRRHLEVTFGLRPVVKVSVWRSKGRPTAD